MGSEQEMHRAIWTWNMSNVGGSDSLGSLAECSVYYTQS